MKTNLVILVSGRGTNMCAILDKKIPFTDITVISNNPHSEGLRLAREVYNTRTVCLNNSATLMEDILEWLEHLKPDLICLAGFMRILSPEVINKYKGKIINIHPSLLPKYPGLGTHARVLASGDDIHGCTVHYATEIVDDGPIIQQSALSVNPSWDEPTLSAKVLELEHELYPTIVERFYNDIIKNKV